MKRFPTALTLLLYLVILKNFAWGQSFLGLDGGFEDDAIIDNVNTYTAAQACKWTKSDTAVTLTNEKTVVRSGANSFKVSMTSTTMKRVYTPEYIIPSSESKWYVQYYRRSTDTTNTQTQRPGNIRDGSEQASSTYSSVKTTNEWEKVTYAPMSALPATRVAGVILTKAIGTGGDVYIDDFCIYAATTVDNIAPSSPTSTSTLQTANTGELFVSWTDALGGVDGGGYIAVRKIGCAPTITPHVNGIYAVGNTIADGEDVVYSGTSSNFIDHHLDPNTVYYYAIYTFDKAYNYSAGVSTTGDVPLPIQLTSFSVLPVYMGAHLNWKTATESNCYGFDVERRAVSNQQSVISDWSKIGFVEGAGNSNSEHVYSYIDHHVTWGRYMYRLKQIDQDGNFQYYGNTEVEIRTATITLTLDNYPNPFNPTTTVVFSVPKDGHATLKVFNIIGQEIGTLFKGIARAGQLHSVLFGGFDLASGVYYYTIEYGGHCFTKRMLMVK